MTPLTNLNSRNLLIAIHDAVATTLAVLASFYLRFEGDLLADRLPLLLLILPFFIVLSVVVCYVFNLTTTKWRFISLPDVLNILGAATTLTLALLVLDYIFVAPNVRGGFFFGKITIILFWVFEVIFLSRSRLVYRVFRLTPSLHLRRAKDAPRPLLTAAVPTGQ